ncbi:hypothetical protein GCM10023238_17170 [Streptomyces heliomycini]
MRAARVMVDNAAARPAVQALAPGCVVATAAAGHGAEGVRRLAALGVSEIARTPPPCCTPAAAVGGRRAYGSTGSPAWRELFDGLARVAASPARRRV